MRTSSAGPRHTPDLARSVSLASTLPRHRQLPSLAHLLTPLRCAVGLQVRLDGPVVSFRGRSVGVDADDLDASAGSVARLVAQTRDVTDEFCNMSSSAASWVKPVRTGAHVLLAGIPELFGGRAVRVAATAADPQLVAELSAAAAEGLLPEPGSRFGWRAGLLLSGDGSILTVDPAAQANGPEVDPDLLLETARTCSVLAASLGAVSSRWRRVPPAFPSTVEVVGSLQLVDGSLLEVPLVQAASSRLIGVPSAHTRPLCSTPEFPADGGTASPHGFTPVGIRFRDGVTVVEHVLTGIRGALVPNSAAPVAATVSPVLEKEST